MKQILVQMRNDNKMFNSRMIYKPDCEENKDAVTETSQLGVVGHLPELQEYVSKIMDNEHQWSSPKLFN